MLSPLSLAKNIHNVKIKALPLEQNPPGREPITPPYLMEG